MGKMKKTQEKKTSYFESQLSRLYPITEYGVNVAFSSNGNKCNNFTLQKAEFEQVIAILLKIESDRGDH